MTEPAAPVVPVQHVDLDELDAFDGLDDQLRDPVAAVNHERLLAVEVHENHLQFVAVAGIDQPRRVENGHSVAKGQSAARLDEPGVAERDRHGDPGRDERPATGRDHDIGARAQIEPGVAVVRVAGHGQLGVQQDDRDTKHVGEGNHRVSGAASSAGSKVRRMLVWMDLEMTGLDPRRDVIVEIATIVTDDELAIVAEGPDLVVHQPAAVLDQMEPFVRDMHTRSGLLPAIDASTVTLDEAGAATLAFIKTHVPVERTVPLCGNSIGTDRRFLDAYLPEIENWLHYRSIDVSSIKELVRRWYPEVRAARPMKTGVHRALDDIRESIEELRYYREHVFRSDAAPAAASEPSAP